MEAVTSEEEVMKATEAFKERVLALVDERRVNMITREVNLYAILNEPDDIRSLANAITAFLNSMREHTRGNDIVAQSDRALYEELRGHLVMLQAEMNNFLRRS
ncbi:hypothetical protein KI440_01820 [Candidatus Saccharibacteria bacterium TM7i]|nr:hypothetical protein KI440_01820 [Candidatus Saccharibacteria bacterium TM7i]